MVIAVLAILAGLTLLAVGGEGLVRGAVGLAARAKVSPLVIGLTVLAAGTSAPELAVGIQAVADDRDGLLIGNVVGSNIANVLLILGISAIIMPLVVRTRAVFIDLPVMIGATGLTWLLASDGTIGTADAIALLGILVAFTTWSIRYSRRNYRAAEEPVDAAEGMKRKRSWALDAAALAIGLTVLIAGARLLVSGAVEVARDLGMSEEVIGLTVLAVGTSLPEIVTSLVAAVRGEKELAVGNVVGSNILNLLGVLSISSLVGAAIGTGGIAVGKTVLEFDMPVMFVVALACLPIFFTDRLITRGEGVLLASVWVAYTTFLLFAEDQNQSLETYASGLLIGVPAVLITCGWGLWRRRRTPA